MENKRDGIHPRTSCRLTNSSMGVMAAITPPTPTPTAAEGFVSSCAVCVRWVVVGGGRGAALGVSVTTTIGVGEAGATERRRVTRGGGSSVSESCCGGVS